MSHLVYLMHTIRIRQLTLQYTVLPSFVGTFRLTDQLCSRKPFLGPCPLAGTLVSHSHCFTQFFYHVLVFNHRLSIQLLGYISSKHWHTDFCWDYSFHPISEREGRYVVWSASCLSVSLKYPGKFVYPPTFS